jgi:hypothetical protein
MEGPPLMIDLKREVDVVDNDLDDLDDEDENQLMIDDSDYENEDDPPPRVTSQEDPDEAEGQVMLDRLPRPVNELNCRQARTFLVKLLRTANGGMNPHYGNPDMKPPFWPGKVCFEMKNSNYFECFQSSLKVLILARHL